MADSEGKKAVVPLSTSWGLQVPKRRKCNNVIFKDSFEEETNPSIMSSRSSLLPAKATDVKDLQWDPSSMTFSDESSFSGGRKHPRSKPRYMENILKRAQERKLERERSTFIRAQKERQKDPLAIDEKEQFVTRAYKQKLEEISELEKKLEKEQRESTLSAKKFLSMDQCCKELLDRNYRRR